MISEELIPKIEKAFGFPLYEWQKEYLTGKTMKMQKGRGNGKTFVYILNLLLSDGEPIKVKGIRPIYRTELWKMDDEIIPRHSCAWETRYNYKRLFFDECLRINDILVENGIKTRIV